MTEPNRLRITSNEIKKKYIHQKSKGIFKKANKKAADWLRRVGYIDIDDLETNDCNNDTNNALKDTTADNIDNINLKKTSGAQIDAKKKLLKIQKSSKKKPYQRQPPPSENIFNDFTDLVDYNNNTSISDLNDIVFGHKRNKKARVSFNISNVGNAETIECNKDNNINDASSSKSAQISAKKIINKFGNLRRKKKKYL